MSPALAALIAGAVAIGGWAAGWLTGPAALAAMGIGIAALTGGGLGGLFLLGSFFVSGSVLSAHGAAGSRRRAAQVLANGWAAALGGLVIPTAPSLGWALLAGGLSAAQADTWATELGRRSRRPPRLITTGLPVATGTSGAVSVLGTLGGGAGAAVMAVIVALIPAPVPAVWVGVGGMGGMLADSVLGATLQARFVCRTCGCTVETPHHCETAATHNGGLRRMTNDAVNLLGTGAGAVITVLATAGWR